MIGKDDAQSQTAAVQALVDASGHTDDDARHILLHLALAGWWLIPLPRKHQVPYLLENFNGT